MRGDRSEYFLSLARRGLLLAMAVCLGALPIVGCGGTGEGGRITVPCDEARCNSECMASGAESGACGADDACVCVRPLDIPEGLSTSLSSGGVVNVASGSYQLSVTVGPVSVGGTTSSATQDLEVGPLPTADPERR